jgi:hypothetical protein
MTDAGVSEVTSSTKVWVGSTVVTVLGLGFGVGLTVTGSLLNWRSDSVLGLYDQSGWSFHNIISGDGKLTLALGIFMALGLLVGLLARSRAGYMLAVVSSALILVLAIYELIHVGTGAGITGPGHGLYLVLGGGVAGVMCAFCGYSMMAARHAELRAAGVAGGPAEGAA